jgi:hypothetical protein
LYGVLAVWRGGGLGEKMFTLFRAELYNSLLDIFNAQDEGIFTRRIQTVFGFAF